MVFDVAVVQIAAAAAVGVAVHEYKTPNLQAQLHLVYRIVLWPFVRGHGQLCANHGGTQKCR